MQESDATILTAFLSQLAGGLDLLRLPAMIEHCRVRKEGGLLYAADLHHSVTKPRSRLCPVSYVMFTVFGAGPWALI